MKNKKQFIPIISLFLFIIKANGQSNLPPVYDIINDTALHTEIPAGYWKMLEDKGGKIIKAHGGELKVESQEGEGAVFMVLIPFK